MVERSEEAAADVPHFRSAIQAGGDDPDPIGTEHSRIHATTVTERCEEGSVEVPHPCGVIPACGDDPGPVGTEHGRLHPGEVVKGDILRRGHDTVQGRERRGPRYTTVKRCGFSCFDRQ